MAGFNERVHESTGPKLAGNVLQSSWSARGVDCGIRAPYRGQPHGLLVVDRGTVLWVWNSQARAKIVEGKSVVVDALAWSNPKRDRISWDVRVPPL